MRYEKSEVLNLVAKMAEKYTGGESSSITYERAQKLMEAVIYCIKEWERGEGIRGTELMPEQVMQIEEAYERGYKLVMEKAQKAKGLYEKLVAEFNDYGCKNYRDTIKEGIPAFLRYYDARFEPQNHIILLDYPLAVENTDFCGVDRIYDYLKKISIEKKVLDYVGEEKIREILERACTDYEELYFGNICYEVLDAVTVQGKTQQEIAYMIVVFAEKVAGAEAAEYLVKVAKDYAVRRKNISETKGRIFDA